MNQHKKKSKTKKLIQILNTIGTDILCDIQLNNQNLAIYRIIKWMLINNSYKEIIYNKFTYRLNSKNYIKQKKLANKCIYKRQKKTKIYLINIFAILLFQLLEMKMIIQI